MIANVQHWTEIIAKKLSGSIRADEVRMLDEWLARDPEHREYYEQMHEVWQFTGAIHSTDAIPDMDLDGLVHKLNTPPKRPVLRELPALRKLRITWRVAATVAAAALLGVLILGGLQRKDVLHLEPIVMVEADGSAVRQVTLPDGSTVVLRQGSTLSYDRAFAQRNVTLKGEAFFDVEHDEERPFSVEAGKGFMRVLGTKFNVKIAPDQSVDLFVQEGRVAFAPAKHKFDAKIFSDGQSGILAAVPDARVERLAVAGTNLTSWTTGKLVFDHATLDHVIADIQRHYDIPLDAADPGLLMCELKADFENATLEEVLETLRFSLNLKIQKAGDTYVISGTPCATRSNK